ncbi:hypothetical protein ACFX2F_002588 [Malus domestica]
MLRPHPLFLVQQLQILVDDDGSAITFEGELGDGVEAGEEGRDDGFRPCGTGGSNWELMGTGGLGKTT